MGSFTVLCNKCKGNISHLISFHMNTILSQYSVNMSIGISLTKDPFPVKYIRFPKVIQDQQ
jgi:hypothetical protein